MADKPHIQSIEALQGQVAQNILENLIEIVNKPSHEQTALEIAPQINVLAHQQFDKLTLQDKVNTLTALYALGKITHDLSSSEAYTVTDGSPVQQALAALTEALTSAGAYDQALRAANLLTYSRTRVEALEQLIDAVLEANQAEAALAVAHGIENTWNKAEALRRVAEGLAQRAQIEEAIRAAEAIEHPWSRDTAFSHIAPAAARSGEYRKAIEVTRGIKNRRISARALRWSLVAIAADGAVKQAAALARTLPDSIERARTLAEIAEVVDDKRWRESLFKEAYRSAVDISSDRRRVAALVAVCAPMARTRSEHYKDTFRRARKAAKRLYVLPEQGDKLLELSQIVAAAGRHKDAFKAASAIIDNLRRGIALSQTAISAAEAGKLRSARQMASLIDVAWCRAEAYRGIAAAAKNQNEALQEMLMSAYRIQNEWRRALALREAAAVLAQAGHFDHALNTADGMQNLKDGSAKARTYRDTAKELVSSAQYERAVEAALRIEDAHYRASSIKSVVKALTKAGALEQAEKLIAALPPGSPEHFSAQNAAAYMEAGSARIEAAFMRFAGYSASRYIQALAELAPVFNNISPGLGASALAEAVRIIGTFSPEWQVVGQQVFHITYPQASPNSDAAPESPKAPIT